MGFGNTGGCASIYNYEMAERHFNREPAPRGKAWYTNQRPLDDARKWHYRLEKHDDGAYYDVCLYHTVMARFHRPEPDGTFRVQYEGDSRSTSSQFMWQVLHTQKEKPLRTTDGRDVVVPIVAGRTGQQFGADLWFRKESEFVARLDVARSSHRQIYKIVSNPEFLQWKKDLRVWLKDVLFVLSLRDVGRVAPLQYNIAYELRERMPGADFSTPPSEALVTLLQQVWDWVLSGYDKDTRVKEARADLLARCYSGYRNPTVHEPLPMFAETLPSRWTV